MAASVWLFHDAAMKGQLETETFVIKKLARI